MPKSASATDPYYTQALYYLPTYCPFNNRQIVIRMTEGGMVGGAYSYLAYGNKLFIVILAMFLKTFCDYEAKMLLILVSIQE